MPQDKTLDWYVAETDALDAESHAAQIGETVPDPRVSTLFINARQLRERADLLLAVVRARTREVTVPLAEDTDHERSSRDHAARPLLPGDVVRVKDGSTPMIVRLITTGQKTVHCAWMERGVAMLGPFQESTLQRAQDTPPF